MSLRIRAMTSNVATTIFVISASMVIAMIGAVAVPQSANALELGAELRLPRVITAPLDRLLDRENEKSPPATTPTDNGASSSDKEKGGSEDNSEVFTPYQGMRINTEPLITLQSLSPGLGQSQLDNQKTIVSSAQEVKGASTVASPASILRATDAGWELFGAPWYQWAMGLGVVALGLWLGQKIVRTRLFRRSSIE